MLLAMKPIATACQSGSGRERAAVGGPEQQAPAHEAKRIGRRREDRPRRAEGTRCAFAQVLDDLAEVDAAQRPEEQRAGDDGAERRRRSAACGSAAGAASGFGKRQAGRGRGAPAAAAESPRGRRCAPARRRAAGGPRPHARARRDRDSRARRSRSSPSPRSGGGAAAASARPTRASSDGDSARPLAPQPIEGAVAGLESACRTPFGAPGRRVAVTEPRRIPGSRWAPRAPRAAATRWARRGSSSSSDSIGTTGVSS